MEMPWWMDAASPLSRVVEVGSASVLQAGSTQRPILTQMVRAGLQSLTGKADGGAAWTNIRAGGKRVALKFNSVGDALLQINKDVARALVESVRSAADCEVTLIEAPPGVAEELAAGVPASGWSDHVVIAAERESIARWLSEVDVVVNVGLLKTHQLAGFSGCLKNLSHALVRRPARYHGPRLPECMAGVWRAHNVHTKVRLNVCNALRMVARHGPGASEADVVEQGTLLMAHDPVACDAAGLDLLNAARQERGWPAIEPGYLTHLQDQGLGRARWERIERIAIRV